MLSSCHTTLYNAATSGDVETLKRELAPDSVLNKEIEAKSVSFYDYGCEYFVDFSCFDASKQTQFDSFWPTVPQWMAAEGTDNMIWADVNPYVSSTIHRFYKRTGWDTAEIYIKQSASSDFPRMDLRYALRFETPTQGTFRCILQGRDSFGVNEGTFRLKDIPAKAK